ncbi:hypothetical protein JX265_012332 [Neoarthrinium moseri]|uniref:Uncharacterized protein n=1 Tax=Neoarthrinium moseri TaxID=1658444 RepID=A0A9P9WAM3_9PEZI|nr:hypothetical protein JX265_012332 [Neoarthrinium moseri]
MSFVTRRGLSTLIPPKVRLQPALVLPVASPSAIGGAPDAVRMKRVVNFYEKLPRGPAPKVEAKGLFGRYEAKHFGGSNASAKRTGTRALSGFVSRSEHDMPLEDRTYTPGTTLTSLHTAIIQAIGLILVIGYPMTYYFHLRHHKNNAH